MSMRELGTLSRTVRGQEARIVFLVGDLPLTYVSVALGQLICHPLPKPCQSLELVSRRSL